MKRQLLYLAQIALLALAYFIAGKLGLRLAFVNPSATAVWPPAGISLAALLLWGPRLWPGVFLGAFLVNMTTAGTLGTSAGIAIGNTLEALLGAYLVRRYANGSKAMGRPRDIVIFALLAGLAATTVSATIGVSTLALAGFAPWEHYAEIWLTWWLGDGVSELIIAPFLLLWLGGKAPSWPSGRAAEALALLLTLVLAGACVFGGLLPFDGSRYPLDFLCIPPLLWAAFRFGQREAASAALLLSGIAIGGTLRGFGPFVQSTPNESLLLLQAFMATITMVGLIVAALVEQRMQNEQALRLQKALLEAQSEASIDGILVVSSQGRILSFNRRFVTMWDIAPETLATRSDQATLEAVRAQVDDPEGFLERVAELYTRPLDSQLDEISLRDGRHFERYSAPVLDPQRTLYGRVWFFRDTSERKRAEERARQAIVIRDQFLSLAAHELKTPMTTMLGSAQLLLRYLQQQEPASERERSRAKIIVDQAQRLHRLISSLLDLSRIHDGRLTLERERLDMAAVVAQIVEEIRPTLSQHRLELRLPGGPCWVEGDRLRLEQVLQNVLQNAIKYSPEGGAIAIELGRRDGQICCAVADQGIGIPEAERARIFEQFYRANNINPAQLSGMGIGLYVVQEIVGLHGGSVGVESAEGQGSTFTICLPASD